MKNGLTPFGRRCRELRTRYALTMAEQAASFKCSAAYISLIELGKRPAPEDYPAKFAEWMSLTEHEARDLSELAFGKLSVIELASSDSERASIAEEFSKTFNILPIERLRELRKLLATNTIPLSYSPRDISVRADLARTVFNPDDKSYVDILKILENLVALVDPNFSFQIEPDSSFSQTTEAFSDMDGACRVVASERIYQTAYRQNEHSRYALVHEFAHWLLHRHSANAFFRLRPGLVISKNKNIEFEADQFARQFIMPAAIVNKIQSPQKLARQCGVPLSVAQIRVNEVCGRVNPDERKRIVAGLNTLANKIGSFNATTTISEAQKKETHRSSVIAFPQPVTAPMVHRPRSRTRLTKSQTGDLFEYAHRKENSSAKLTNRGIDWFKDNGWR